MKNNWTIAIIFLLIGWNSFRIYEINNMEIVGWMSVVAFIGTIIYVIKGLFRETSHNADKAKLGGEYGKR